MTRRNSILWRRLAAYGELRNARIAKLAPHKAALAKLAFVGLQQRLLSSIAAFLRTLKAHRASLAAARRRRDSASRASRGAGLCRRQHDGEDRRAGPRR